MLVITDGQKKFNVTRGSFGSIYKDLGFRVYDPEKSFYQVEENVVSEEEQLMSTLLEKPISQWTKEDAKLYTDKKNIDVSNARTFSEVKTLIKQSLEGENSL